MSLSNNTLGDTLLHLVTQLGGRSEVYHTDIVALTVERHILQRHSSEICLAAVIQNKPHEIAEALGRLLTHRGTHKRHLLLTAHHGADQRGAQSRQRLEVPRKGTHLPIEHLGHTTLGGVLHKCLGISSGYKSCVHNCLCFSTLLGTLGLLHQSHSKRLLRLLVAQLLTQHLLGHIDRQEGNSGTNLAKRLALLGFDLLLCRL